VQEDLGVYWAALNILVARGELDPTTPIPVGDHRGSGFAGFMSVQAVLRTVQSGWGRWIARRGPLVPNPGGGEREVALRGTARQPRGVSEEDRVPSHFRRAE